MTLPLLVVDLFNVVVDQQPVILKAEFSVVTNWGLDDLLALELLLRIAEACEVAAPQDLSGSRPLPRVHL